MSYVWGVDVSTRRVAFGFAHTGHHEHHWRYFDLPTARGVDEGHRLALWHTQTYAGSDAFAEDYPPVCVFVEQPMGPGSERWSYTVGVVLAALADATRAPVWLIGIGQWKKLAIGNGAAKKWDVMEWARQTCDYDGAVQDEADALGVARAGIQMVDLGAPEAI